MPISLIICKYLPTYYLLPFLTWWDTRLKFPRYFAFSRRSSAVSGGGDVDGGISSASISSWHSLSARRSSSSFSWGGGTRLWSLSRFAIGGGGSTTHAGGGGGGAASWEGVTRKLASNLGEWWSEVNSSSRTKRPVETLYSVLGHFN